MNWALGILGRALAWIAVLATGLAFSLPGGAILLELVRQRFSFRLPLAVEAGAALLCAMLILWGGLSPRVLPRCGAWVVALMGHAALANALSPGRELVWQLTWLGGGAVLGAVLGAWLTPGRRNLRPANGASPATSVSPLDPVDRPTKSVPLVPRPTLVAWACVACVLGAMILRHQSWNVFQARILQAVSDGQGQTICDDHAVPTLVCQWFEHLPSNPMYRSLRCIDLGPSVGDEELAGLVDLGMRDLPDLSDLRLNHSRVTDAGLVIVAPMSRLERLALGPATTDAGLIQVQGLTGLKSLSLARTRITGEGLQYSARLPTLYMLNLTDTRITDEDLPRLKTLSQLTCLDLSGTRITDAGLAHLKELPSLCTLLLMNTSISDAGIVHLKNLPRLKWLHLQETQVTSAGLKDLLDARPWIRVTHLPRPMH